MNTRGPALGVATISGHRRRVPADGEQQVGHHLIRFEPEYTVRCVPHVPQQAVSTMEEARYRANCLPVPREPFKRETAYLATRATEGTGEVFSQ